MFENYVLDEQFSKYGPISAMAASPGNLLEMQVLSSHPQFIELETLSRA